MAPPSPPASKPWHAHLTIDLLAYVASYTIFHPFVAWVVPLSLRAQGTPYHFTSFIVSVAYASLVTVFHLLSLVNKRLAYGPPRPVNLNDEVIVITGGAGGLGLLIAEVYGLRGASVAVLDVAAIKEAEARGINYYHCDVGDAAQVEKAADQIKRDLGTPTIIINNAGVVNGKTLLDLSPADVERNFRVNLLSHFYIIRQFLSGMMSSSTGGTIVTVSSVLGKIGAAQLSDYAAAKAGLIAMHTSLIGELRHSPNPGAKNIRTILVTPGQLATPLFGTMASPSNFVGPVVEPVEVANAIMKMVDAGEGGELSFPLYACFMDWMNVLPAAVQRAARAMSQLDTAMRNFRVERDDKPGK
ncbi:uncharacterized protein J3D65DRAFT_583277 [Phyllosticta citribraziliensis]|uniref:Ketoreductase domain-containing protein n=1 Tax=Phyllosticta citribraziliensis TaxID=989973 RepID=A0ABR1M3B4_9PEZI